MKKLKNKNQTKIIMSLTDFISHKNFQELRDKFKTVFPRPTIKLIGSLKAPPLTNNHSIVGQAFDYLLRFTLEHKYGSKIKSDRSWVADSAYRMLEANIQTSNSKILNVGFRKDIEKDRKAFLSMLQNEYSNAKVNYKKYLVDGLLTEPLVKSVLYLARLDVFLRARMIDPNLGNENELDIQDVLKLMSLIDENYFKVKSQGYINPTFGEGSLLVGGADADIIIDDTLIDIKVSKHLTLEREHLNQTIGYFILSLIGGVNSDENCKPIKNIGIYFARYGVLWKIPLSELANEDAILEFKEWFSNYADQKIWNGRLVEMKKGAIERRAEKAAPKTKTPVKQKTTTSKKGIKYFIDSSKESIGSEESANIELVDAMKKFKLLKADDHIGFINDKGNCIQFVKGNKSKWMIDCPILDKSDNYIHSLVDNNLTAKKVSEITSMFFLNKKWNHLCKLSKQ